jgi:hypothetical protein
MGSDERPSELSAIPKRVSRRRWLGPTTVAAAVIVITAGIAIGVSVSRSSGLSSSSASGPVVPWNGADTQTVPYGQVDYPRPVSAPNGTRPCSAEDFTLESVRSSRGADGMITTSYILRSIASANCAMDDWSVALVDDTGKELPNDIPPPMGPGPNLQGPPLVRPGQLIVGDVWWGWARGTSRPARLAFLTRGNPSSPPDLRLSVSLQRFQPTGRPASMQISVWRAGWSTSWPSVHDAGSLDSVVPTIHVPSSVVEGNALRYTVELQNPTATPVRLANCPDVVQLLGNPPKFIDGSAIQTPLNCAAAPPAIRPHSSVTFAFEIDTSAVAIPSTYTAHPNVLLRWELVDGTQMLLYEQTTATVTP